MTKTKKSKKVSPYSILSKWLRDGNSKSKIPEALVKDKTIGPQYILYYFQASPYLVFISELFNNYDMYGLNRLDVLKFLKRATVDTGYRPQYIPRVNTSKTKLQKALRRRYQFLKSYECSMLTGILDSSPEQEEIYEALGLGPPPKKRKHKANSHLENVHEVTVEGVETDLKVASELNNSKYSLANFLDNFVIQEV